jgi:hypothetical protein
MAHFKVTQPRTVNDFKVVAQEVLLRYEQTKDSSILLNSLQDLAIGKFGNHSNRAIELQKKVVLIRSLFASKKTSGLTNEIIISQIMDHFGYSESTVRSLIEGDTDTPKSLDSANGLFNYLEQMALKELPKKKKSHGQK